MVKRLIWTFIQIFSEMFRIWLHQMIYFWAMKKYFRASINSNRLVCHCHGFIYRNMFYILFRRINWIRLSQLFHRYSTTSFVTDYILTSFDLKRLCEKVIFWTLSYDNHFVIMNSSNNKWFIAYESALNFGHHS